MDSDYHRPWLMMAPVHALVLSLGLTGFAPELPPDEPVATAATQPTDAVPDPTPPPVVGSVAIIIVGALDPEVLAAAVAVRLASHGVSPSFATASDFSPGLGPAPEDRIADIWVLVSASELRVIITDPSHAHTLVRTLRIDEPLQPTSLAEASAAFIEDGVVMATTEAWPPSTPEPPVVVEPPLPPIEPVVPEPEPPRRSRGNHPRGIVLGVAGGVAWVRDELHHEALGIPVLVRLGYVFGHNPRFPDLRASVEARVGSISVPSSNTKLTLVQFLAESRIGFTRGPVWMFGIVGLGTGFYSRRRGGEAIRDSNDVMGTLGLGTSVRITRYLAIHLDGVASGHPDLVGRLGLDMGLTGYIDLPRKERGR